MKCPEFMKILDLVDNRLGKVETQKIKGHISTCAKCTDQAEWARKTLSSMKSSGLVDAPEYAIQKAISIFPKEKVKLAEWVIAKLNFDSWMSPQTAGVRSEDAGPRQRIYQTESYKIILMNEPGRWIGQVVSEKPGVEAAGCLVELSSGKKHLGSTITNQNGEFMFSSNRNNDLQLKIHGQAETVVIGNLN